MSAMMIRTEWKLQRAISALSHGKEIDIDAYAVELELEAQEVTELFDEAATYLGMVCEIAAGQRVLH